MGKRKERGVAVLQHLSGAESPAITWQTVIGREGGCDVKSGARVAGIGKEMRHFLLLGSEIVEVDARAG